MELKKRSKRKQSCWECMCLNMFVQERVSIMGKVNDVGEKQSMINGEVSN